MNSFKRPLTVNYRQVEKIENDDSFSEPQFVLDESNHPTNLIIKNVEKLYIMSNATKIGDDLLKGTKKKNRRPRRNNR